MAEQLKRYLFLFLRFIIANIGDIFILSGFTVLTVSLFLFVSKFAGCICLSAILIILGLILCKIRINSN